jgi:hypothetical protein
MSLTIALSICAVATGTIGTVLAILNRIDVKRGHRARALPLRAHLIPLREAVADVRARPERARTVTTSPNFKGHIQALEEAKSVCSDKRLLQLLTEVISRCLNVGNAVPEDPDGPVPYALTAALDHALADINRALDRLDRIERSAPGKLSA